MINLIDKYKNLIRTYCNKNSYVIIAIFYIHYSIVVEKYNSQYSTISITKIIPMIYIYPLEQIIQ